MGAFTFIHGDPLMVDYTPSAAVTAGDVVVFLGKACIAHTDIPADTLGAVAWPNGRAVYQFDEVITIRDGEGENLDVGSDLYVESDGTTFSELSTDNFLVGTLVNNDTSSGNRIIHGG